MYSDEICRAFLLKMADSETEAAIEEAILDGSIDADYLRQIEDELIDDSLFGRLSQPETIHFESDFLSTAERRRKLSFAAGIKQYSAQHLPPTPRHAEAPRFGWFGTIKWNLSLAGALACLLITTGWLVERDFSLRRELALATRQNDERQRLISSLQQEQYHLRSQAVTQDKPPKRESQNLGRSVDLTMPVIHLSRETTRGPAVLPILRMSPKARMGLGTQEEIVSIVLDSPFPPGVTVREELIDSGNKTIWAQQFSTSSPGVRRGMATIKLPAALFSSGDYRLRVQTIGGTERERDVRIPFRVHRE